GKIVYALGKRKLWKIPLHAPAASVKAIDLPPHNLLRVSADGSRLVSVSPDGLRFWRIWDDRVSLEYDAGRTPAVVENLQIGPDGSTAIFIAEGPHTPRDVWCARIGIRAGNLSRLNPSLTGKPMGQVRPFQYLGPGGKVRKGVMILPAGYTVGKSYPTVVLVYPTARYTAHPAKFALGDDARVANPHLLAAHGIAVVAAGMADGRSRRIPELVALVNAAADAAIRNGWSDPNRLGLYGQSDGGFVVNAVITRTTRYRAAVSVAGYADYISRWCSLDDQGNAYGIFSSMTSWGNLLQGTPMSKPRNFIDHSPLFQMDKVRTPLLLLHGRMDPAVPYEQSDEIFVALRAMRQQVEYALYEGEGHHPADWTMPHQLDAAKRILNWYLKFLTH
ncbi:MAG: S9 family peptidase, partial [Lentisphaerae bacterium]